MFINFSNHPSGLWEELQLAAAQQYGDIVDVPFPEVSPEWTAEEVEQLADKYAEMLGEMCDSSTMVHVMGEMTFTYAVVSRLKTKGVNCVASTTKRTVSLTADGKKVSEFHFVQFRHY